ncbi:hypothetical protein AB0L41_41995 [Amycolatopsis mediterranei]|uniref:hypothetical protein n=1 Tax=Amycolatopsis mediterranei TaxID=33910 RepID=UPI00344666F3
MNLTRISHPPIHRRTGERNRFRRLLVFEPIKDIAVGDRITNAEPDNARTRHHTVRAVHVTDDDTGFDDVTVKFCPAGAQDHAVSRSPKIGPGTQKTPPTSHSG